eukprot:COSAG06_NODE_2264_length_7211_cov_161.802587_6_plen_168_part_00
MLSMLLTYVIRRKLQLLPRQVEPKSIEKTHRISGNQTRRDAFRKWKLSASTVRSIVNCRSKQTDTQRVRFNFHDSTLPPPSPFYPQTENLHLMRATGTVTALNDGETWELRERRGIHSIDPAFREKMGKKAAHPPSHPQRVPLERPRETLPSCGRFTKTDSGRLVFV